MFGICAVILTLFVIVVFSIESYFYPSQYIDTKFPSGFSESNFSDIAIGSSIQEVISKLGEPIWKEGCGGCWEQSSYVRDDHVLDVPVERKCDAPCSSVHQQWYYSDDGACTWWDFAWKEFSIAFDQGVVTEKSEVWHGD
jgi:hypothetical protein